MVGGQFLLIEVVGLDWLGYFQSTNGNPGRRLSKVRGKGWVLLGDGPGPGMLFSFYGRIVSPAS